MESDMLKKHDVVHCGSKMEHFLALMLGFPETAEDTKEENQNEDWGENAGNKKLWVTGWRHSQWWCSQQRHSQGRHSERRWSAKWSSTLYLVL